MVSDATGAYLGHFNDGLTAASHDVSVSFGPDGLLFGPKDSTASEHWTYEGLRPVRPVAKSGPARLGYEGAQGARLIIASPEFADRVLQLAPHLGTAAGHKTTAKIAALCFVGISAFAAIAWLVLSAAPLTVAKLLPNSLWSHLGEQIETTMVKSARQCTNQEGKRALAKMAFKFSGNAEADTVRVYDIPIMNAFAMAGGRIVLTSKLIEKADSPDEVAGVLAHELGHVKALHPEAQIVRVLGLQLIMSALWGGSGVGDAAIQGGAMLTILRYTRTAEREADEIAINLMKKAKIDPNGLANFFKVVKKQTGESDKKNASGYLSMLRTHPSLDERIERIRKLKIGSTTPSLSKEDWDSLKKICS